MDAFFSKELTRVVVTGSESVGKTTLAQELASHFSTTYVAEFVREYAASKDGAIDFGDHGVIARGQMALEDSAAAVANKLLIQDTDLVSTVVYCEHYFERCPQFIVDLAVQRKAHLYLLLSPDVPWVADGIRDRGSRREEMHELFRERLTSLDMNYEIISGTFEARRTLAIDAITSLLKSKAM